MKTVYLAAMWSLAGGLWALAQAAPAGCFTDWPAGAAPAEVGKRVAENVIPRPFRYEAQPGKPSNGVIYPEVIAWYGALTFAQLAGDSDLSSRLVRKFDRF